MKTATNHLHITTIDGLNAMLDATQAERNAAPAPATAGTVGKCQICERQFKIRDDGRINMHGHNRAGRGRAAGFCPGSARMPAPAVEALVEQVEQLRAEDAVRFAGLIGKYEQRIAVLTASAR